MYGIMLVYYIEPLDLLVCFQAAICIGVCIMLASTVGGFRNIIADASTYEFYT